MNCQKGDRTKNRILLMSITLLVCIILNNWMSAFSQSTSLSVSIGYEIRDSKTEISALETLKLGGQWQVFDLVDKQYLGKAKVIQHYKFECILAKGDHQGSHLINDRHFPTQKPGANLLLVKRVPLITSKVDISQVIFAKLPDSLKSILNRRNSGDVGKEKFYAVDIDSDSLPDIVAISGEVSRYVRNNKEREPYIEVFVKSNSEWNKRDRYSWLNSACR